MKCIQCKKEINEGFWCSIKCKKQFFIEQYYSSSMIYDIETSIKIEKKQNRKKAIKDFEVFQNKNPDKYYVDFILSLGEDEVKKNDKKR